MTFAKLSEGSSSPTFGGCDQLFLAPRSKIANRCGSALRRKKCTHHHGEPPPANRGCQFMAPSIFFPFHPLADVRRTVFQLHPNRLAIFLETSPRRDLPASHRTASSTNATPVLNSSVVSHLSSAMRSQVIWISRTKQQSCMPADLNFRHDESATVLPRRKQIHDPKISNCKSLNQGGMQIGRST
jgi:hypothetical protein